MNIFESIRRDHDIQRKLLDQLIDTSGNTKERASLFKAVKTELEVHANAFLHHMVRNLAGVLIAIGKGEQQEFWAQEILEKSPTSIKMLKFAFNLTDDGMVGQQVFAGEATRLAYMTDEAEEGRDAFLEKRDRDFSRFPWHY